MPTTGDAAAFETLFNRYRDGIYKLYLNRTGGNRDDADDLLQETFIKVFLNLGKYDTAFTFGQWIYTIARNTFIDFMRKKRDDLQIDTSPAGGTALHQSPFARSYARKSASSTTRTANSSRITSHMTPRYRRLIELRFFKEYSYEEIAAELDIPLGTVKTQIHRARTQLCKLIVESGIL